MEDENELPYLVYSRRDDDRTSVGGHAFIKKDFENVPFEEFAIYMNRLILSQEHKIRIINSIEVKMYSFPFTIKAMKFALNLM